MPPRDSQLSALVALIADATKIVEAHYKKVEAMPYVPSLDDLDAHPLDGVIAGDKELCTAIQTIEGACSQLCATIARPNHTVLNVRTAKIDVLQSDSIIRTAIYGGKLYCVHTSI
jgi:hypothetical protein